MAVFGDTLRQARAHKGVTLKEAEQATRINRHHLLALEEEQFDDLPPLIYQRGIVRNYASYLNLDTAKLLLLFESARGVVPDDPPLIAPTQPLDVPTNFTPNFAIIAFLVVMSAVMFAWMYSAYFAPQEAASTPTEIIPTVTAVSADILILPSPTPAPPTPTATATPSPEPTSEPLPTEEPETVEPVADGVDATTVETPTDDFAGEVVEEADEPAATESIGEGLSITFYANSDIASLQVVADGTLVFEGSLAAGDATGYLQADEFQVVVDDPTALTMVNEDGTEFQMGDSYFSLP